MIKAEYQKMHLFLCEDQHLHLHTMEREAKEIFQQLKESELRMMQQKESLKEMYRELTEMCHKPDMELLQDGIGADAKASASEPRAHFMVLSWNPRHAEQLQSE